MGKPPASAFPSGSDPDVLTQPQGRDNAAIQAWETAAGRYASGGGPTCAQLNYFQGLDDPAKPLLACDQAGTSTYLLAPTLIPGTQIADAKAGAAAESSQGWTISITFTAAGLTTWSTYTAGHVGTQTAFTLDSEVLTAPTINGAITTATTMVSGSFTQASAQSLADSLKFGALPLTFDWQARVVG